MDDNPEHLELPTQEQPAAFFQNSGLSPSQQIEFGSILESEGTDLLLPKEAQTKRFTAARVERNRERYNLIVEALGAGMSMRTTARIYGVSANVVSVIAVRSASTVEALKKKNGPLFLRAATLCVESFLEDLATGMVDPKTKAIAAGIFAQNGLVFAGEPSAIIANVTARPELTVEAWNEFLESLPRANVKPSDSQSDVSDKDIKQIGHSSGPDGSLDVQAHPPKSG